MIFIRHVLCHVAALAVLLALCPVAAGQESKTLTYQFKKGDQFDFTIATTNSGKHTVGKTTTFAISRFDVDVVWQIQDVDPDGKAKISGLLKRIRLEVNTTGDPQGNVVAFNSADPNFKDHGMAKLVGPFQKQGVTWQMDRLGNLSQVQLPEELLKALKDDPQAPREGAEDLLMEYFYNWFHPVGLVFPGSEIKDGTAWKNKVREMNYEGLLTHQQAEFKREGTEKLAGSNLERIAIRPIITMDVGGVAKQKGFKINIDNNQGHVFVDGASGMIIEAEIGYAMTMQSADDTTLHALTKTTMKRTEKKQ